MTEIDITIDDDGDVTIKTSRIVAQTMLNTLIRYVEKRDPSPEADEVIISAQIALDRVNASGDAADSLGVEEPEESF